MPNEQKDNQLGETLSSLLKARSLSMRKLSTLSGIDTATISRIVNGKQKPKLSHLERFAVHLGVPASHLLQAAGFGGMTADEHPFANIHSTLSSITEILQASKLIGHPFKVEDVQQELAKYEPYALTEEGQRIIVKDFPMKIASVNGAGPFIDELKKLYEHFCANEVPVEKRAIMGSALLYFVLSADVIPDYVFPIGYLDDAIAVQLVLARLYREDLEAGSSMDSY